MVAIQTEFEREKESLKRAICNSDSITKGDNGWQSTQNQKLLIRFLGAQAKQKLKPA